ncbi:cyclase [Dyadobacter sediminis]|nr:cyclase [Dyadobacter sediminis]
MAAGMLKTIVHTLFCCFFFVPLLAEDNWKKVTEEDEIKVFSRYMPGSKIKALKVECVLKAKASELVALLLDVEAATEWVYKTRSCKLLRTVSPSELYYYSEVSLPWPLENRDFVAHLMVSQDKVSRVVTVDGPVVAGMVQNKEGVVRVMSSKGMWVITPVNGGQIKLVYTLHVDPGGAIPAWAVNLFAAQGPLETFKNMKEQLKASKYRNASLPFILNG